MMMYRDDEVVNDIVGRITSTQSPDVVTSFPVQNTSDLRCSTSTPGTNDCSVKCNLPNENTRSCKSDTDEVSIHKFWSIIDVDDLSMIEDAFSSVESLYIADGHHRSEHACTIADEFLESQKGSSNSARPAAQQLLLMAVLFPQSQLQVLPFHRCIRSIENRCNTANEGMQHFMEILFLGFHVRAITSGVAPDIVGDKSDESNQSSNSVGSIFVDTLEPCLPGHISMYLGQGQWFDIWPRKHFIREAHDLDEAGSCLVNETILSSLDVQILVDRLFLPLFGGELNGHDSSNRRNTIDDHIIYISGHYNANDLANIVDTSQAHIAFCVAGIATDTIMNLADANLLLPPKVTTHYFRYL